MCHTNEYESADNDVEHRISRYENQDASRVRCQPYVILANKELEGKYLKLEIYRKSGTVSQFCLI